MVVTGWIVVFFCAVIMYKKKPAYRGVDAEVYMCISSMPDVGNV